MPKLCSGCVAFQTPQHLDECVYNKHKGAAEGQVPLHSIFFPSQCQELTEPVTEVYKMRTTSLQQLLQVFSSKTY